MFSLLIFMVENCKLLMLEEGDLGESAVVTKGLFEWRPHSVVLGKADLSVTEALRVGRMLVMTTPEIRHMMTGRFVT